MDNPFAAIAAAAGETAPMASPSLPPIAGRVLLVDGDGMAYFCAGNDDTSPGQARANLHSKITSAMHAARCEGACVLTTAQGSNKGHRYAVARVKPYQGQRSGSRRPKNWQYLRDYLEAGVPGHMNLLAANAEADDLFGRQSTILGHENVVIYTQDKDMRMIPGWHLDWKDHTMFFLSASAYRAEHGGKPYGEHWFWLQMLHGDAADNIPGLPKYLREDGKLMLCGEVTAGKLLDQCETSEEAAATVKGLYKGFYGDTWAENILEQGILLWMRRDEKASALDVVAEGRPLHGMPQAAIDIILKRIAEAQV